MDAIVSVYNGSTNQVQFSPNAGHSPTLLVTYPYAQRVMIPASAVNGGQSARVIVGSVTNDIAYGDFLNADAPTGSELQLVVYKNGDVDAFEYNAPDMRHNFWSGWGLMMIFMGLAIVLRLSRKTVNHSVEI